MVTSTPGAWTHDLPGGYTVELCGSSTGRRPGETGGMSTNSSTLWCRLSRAEWSTGWCIVAASRSQVKARAWWLPVESVADIGEAWAGCCDEPLNLPVTE